MQIFVCGCLEEGMLSMTDKRINVVLDEFFIPSFDCRFFKIFWKDDIFVCCREIILFCYNVHRIYFTVKACRTSEFSCFVALKYGYKNICPTCISVLSKKLFPFLVKIK